MKMGTQKVKGPYRVPVTRIYIAAPVYTDICGKSPVFL